MKEANFKKIGLFTGLGILASYLCCKNAKEIYIAQTEASVEWKNIEKTQIQSPKVKEILRRGFGNHLQDEQEFLLSKPLFSKALEKTTKKLNKSYIIGNFNEFYNKYHVEPKQEKKEPNTPIFQIKVETESRDLSSTLAKEIVETYHELRNQSVYSAGEKAVKYLQEEIEKTNANIKQIDPKDEKTAEPKKDKSHVFQLLGQTKQELQKTERNLIKAKERVKNLSNKIKDLITAEEKDKSIPHNPIAQMVETQLLENKRRKETLVKEQPTPDPQLLENINKTIEDLENNLKQLRSNPQDTTVQRIEIEKQLQPAKVDQEYLEEQIKVIKEQMSLYEKQINELSKEPENIILTKRENAMMNAQSEWLTSELEKVREYMVTLSKPTVVQTPNITKEDPSTPWTSLTIILGGLIGGIIGLIVPSFSRKHIDDFESIEKMTEFLVLATCPSITNEKLNNTLEALKTKDFNPLENFRFMTQKIDFYREQKAPVTLLFTSPKNSLDSIYTAIHTAFTYAKKGEKVLIVDINSHKQSLTYLVSSEKEKGICEWTLAGCLRNDIGEYILKTAHPNLEIIPYGKVVSAYITATEMELMVKTLRNYADVVIFMTSPCNTNKIVTTFANNIDFVCLTTPVSKTSDKDTVDACSLLKQPNSEANILILTDMEENNLLNSSPF